MISLMRQCELVGLPRSSYYYEPAGESTLNLELMRLIDEQYTRTPFYGVPRMTEVLRGMGYPIGHKRIERLMGFMGLQAICPKKNLSKAVAGHKKYPYLLRNLSIDHPDHVWASDITYIRLRGGFLYLVAIMDWFTRYVLSWRLSNTLDSYFCIEALEEALERYGQPEIFNTDQGAQFTSDKFTAVLEKRGVKISMDGRGRAFDNIMVERLWRSVKYEEVYLKDYCTPGEAFEGLGDYFDFYNNERLHQSLGYKPPRSFYPIEGKDKERLASPRLSSATALLGSANPPPQA